MAKQRCSKHPFYYEPCSVCSQFKDLESTIAEQNKDIEIMFEKSCELEKELNSISEELEKTINLAYKSYNPEAKLKLSVNDLLVVRGIFVANSFLFNSLHNIDDCIANKKDETTKEQLTLIKKDLEKEWQRVVDLLNAIQSDLFYLGFIFANPNVSAMQIGVFNTKTKLLEKKIDFYELKNTPLTNFILPTGHKCATQLHLARAVCRRAERRAVEFAKGGKKFDATLKYINRLSDLLFVLARYTNTLYNEQEIIWKIKK